jgi:hypothetical protein
MRDLIREDKKRTFRTTQIENEGNDPVKSGISYGTPHDLATMYGRKGVDGQKVPTGYDELVGETNPEGRPRTNMSIYGTQNDPLGRDRLGTHDMKGGYESQNDKLKEGSLATKSVFFQNQDLFKERKKLIFEQDHTAETSTLLDESNIKDLEK